MAPEDTCAQFMERPSVSSSMRPQAGHALIYGLVSPEGTIRYVGKTEACARKRLLTHWRSAHARPKNKRSHKEAWLCSLEEKPNIVILETCAIADWETTEQRWISRLRAEGVDLTNATPGGDGRAGGWHWSDEDRERIGRFFLGKKKSHNVVEKTALALRGRKRSDEQRANISAGRKGIGWTSSARESARALRSCCLCGTGPFTAQAMGYHRRKCKETVAA